MMLEPIVKNVLLSSGALASKDRYEIVDSNIVGINYLKSAHFLDEQMNQDALRSYYVDFYVALLNNGGFSQFVLQTKWNEVVVNYIKEGFTAMGAKGWLDVFLKREAFLENIDFETAGAQAFFSGVEDSDALKEFTTMLDDAYIDASEDIIKLNANWLESLPSALFLAVEKIQPLLDEYILMLPNREELMEKSLSDEPRHVKLIRALCAEAEQNFSYMTGYDDVTYKGDMMGAWHFVTDTGLHYLVDLGNRALMIEDEYQILVSQVSTNSIK